MKARHIKRCLKLLGLNYAGVVQKVNTHRHTMHKPAHSPPCALPQYLAKRLRAHFRLHCSALKIQSFFRMFRIRRFYKVGHRSRRPPRTPWFD